jgi:indole-3-acetate monooxygenase
LSIEIRSPEEYVTAARRIAPLADAESDAGTAAGVLSDAVVDAFHAEGLFRMLLPPELGGGDADLATAFTVVEEISRADGSAGWCLMAGMSTLAIVGTHLAEDAVAEILAHPRALTAGQLAPLGTAEFGAGGYRIEGHFGFASGSAHASHILGGYREHAGGKQVKLENGMPNVLCVVVPIDRVEFLGNWDVIGLIATRSEDYRVPEQVVAAGFSFPLFAGRPVRGNAACRVGVNPLTCMAHAAWACGMGRRALDEVAAVALSKRRPGRQTLVDDAVFQYDYGRAEADLEGARAGALTVLHELETAAAVDAIDQRLRAKARLVTTHACETAGAVTSLAYRYCGSVGLRNGSVIQRVYRDVSAGEQHIFTSHSSVTDAASVYLQAAPDSLFL